MADLIRKHEAIRRIEHLQLSIHLISALDDQNEAEFVTEVLHYLEHFAAQWN